MSMFCYQCEQTKGGQGCTSYGVCGKDPQVAALQDLLVSGCKAISTYYVQAKKNGVIDEEVDQFVSEALFTTVTNVNFDPARMSEVLVKADKIYHKVKKYCYESAGEGEGVADIPVAVQNWQAGGELKERLQLGQSITVQNRIGSFGPDISGLQELLTYGLKGTAAYAVHARTLGNESSEVYEFFHTALAYLADPNPELEKLLGLCLQCGEVNLKVMEMLDSANTGAYGQPVPTQVRITAVKGKAILVSGHDLKDLEELLKQTEGKGINIYTHGEMLPAHGYPELKSYKHLVGNYGGAWQDQQKEFDQFPGAILMTTNCIQKPKETYQGRIFTTGLVAWPNVVHCDEHDFSQVIEAAQEAEGFTEDGEEKFITVGFGHDAVLGVADKVIEAVKAGAIKHFFLVGGCDGAKPGRNYYSDFAKAVPEDAVILTLACGKYRFNKENFGDIGGIPRLLDIGQCNDAYSAVKIASALAQAFDCGVNDLPLSMILSWYEQKAVCILLSLLHLGITNIRLGPTLPAFVSPAVLDVLVEKFSLKPIGSVEEDIQACLAGN